MEEFVSASADRIEAQRIAVMYSAPLDYTVFAVLSPKADCLLTAHLQSFRFAPPTASTGQGGDHALTINAGHLMGAGQFFQLAGIWAASTSNFSERKGKIP